ncbi:ARM REPEAT PROTEIN INTERACTING WITH ABF2 isoform X2 [Helianthus annuus]|uniref:ARM REPEAT PROTEIN INTERACTING WITH ABF2 isoform X2 n=1 Tax=Helianthus annuus TaxID=4232 RepID=UPI00165320B1|nr:ARM REPEAT PROTEIN INTERACTING WITH ABF2 isoform X2 [Helianthus annuus]
MDNQKCHEQTTNSRSSKRKLDDEFIVTSSDETTQQDLASHVRAQVQILDSTVSSLEADRAIVKHSIHILSELAKNQDIVNLIVESGGVSALVQHLQAPEWKELSEPRPYEHEVEKGSAFTLGLLALKIVDCNALPTLILMLQSEDVAIHYEAVGVIGNLVHSSPNIKKEVLRAGALQPVIELLSSSCLESQREAALLLGQFANGDTDCKIDIVQKGAVGPLIDMLQSPDAQVREMSTFALGRLAQAGIAHGGGIPPLLKLLDSKDDRVQHNAAFALFGLADNEYNVADFIRVGGVQKLQDGEFIFQPTRDCVAKTLKRLEEKVNERICKRSKM